MANPVDLNRVHDSCRAFVHVIEEILERRRIEAMRQSLSIKWLLTDFYAQFPCYPDIRRGKISRPPTREDVLRITRYLMCPLEETNRILIATRYVPVEDYVEGDALECALVTGQRLLHYLPFPAYVVTRDASIHRWNKYIPMLFGISDQELRETPLEQRNTLRYIFDPQTPVYSLLSKDRKWWRYTAELNIFRFKIDNILCQYDAWYEQRKESLSDLPGFEDIWNKIQVDTRITNEMAAQMDFPEYVTVMFTPDGQPLKVRGLHINFIGTDFPRIVAYLPDDANARCLFTLFGIPTPENWWGYKSTSR